MLFIDRKACRDRQELLRHEDEKREKNSNRKSFVGFNILGILSATFWRCRLSSEN